MAALGGKPLVRRGEGFDELGLVTTVRETEQILDDEEYQRSLEEIIDGVDLAPVFGKNIFIKKECYTARCEDNPMCLVHLRLISVLADSDDFRR